MTDEPTVEQLKRQMALRYIAAIAVGLLAVGYIVAIIFSKIDKTARIDFPAIVVVLFAGATIALLCSSHGLGFLKDVLSRVQTFEISSMKVRLNQIQTQQIRQSSQLDLLQLLAPLVLSERERRHLLNLRQGRT